MPAEAVTVRDLRRLWKPHKERLNGHAAEHPTTIRFHRACSCGASDHSMMPNSRTLCVFAVGTDQSDGKRSVAGSHVSKESFQKYRR